MWPDLIPRDRHYNTHHLMMKLMRAECAEYRIFCASPVVVVNYAYVDVFEPSCQPLFTNRLASRYLTYDKTIYMTLFQFIIYYDIYFYFFKLKK